MATQVLQRKSRKNVMWFHKYYKSGRIERYTATQVLQRKSRKKEQGDLKHQKSIKDNFNYLEAQ